MAYALLFTRTFGYVYDISLGSADEELRICYIDASMDRDARQNVLVQGFGFKCRCPRCLSGD